MKKLILLLLIVPMISFGQLEFGSGFSIDPNVVLVEGVDSTELYNRIKTWVANTYINPNEVTVVDTPKQIRIRAISSNFLFYKTFGVTAYIDTRYDLTLDIKEGKYRFTFTVDSPYMSASDDFNRLKNYRSANGIPYTSSQIWKNGKLRKNGLSRQSFKTANETLNFYFESIKTAVLNPKLF